MDLNPCIPSLSSLQLGDELFTSFLTWDDFSWINITKFLSSRNSLLEYDVIECLHSITITYAWYISEAISILSKLFLSSWIKFSISRSLLKKTWWHRNIAFLFPLDWHQNLGIFSAKSLTTGQNFEFFWWKSLGLVETERQFHEGFDPLWVMSAVPMSNLTLVRNMRL